ncbi:MAG: hypothetical protein WDW36_000556 [Sanguina aurantia]
MVVRSSYAKHSAASDPLLNGGKGLRPELLILLQRSSLLEKYDTLHQRAAARRGGSVRTFAMRMADISVRFPGKAGHAGGDHMIVLTPLDVAALQRLTMPIAVLVRGAMQEPLASDSAFKQESSFYRSDCHSAAGLQVIAFNDTVKSLLSVDCQQEYLLHLREQLFLHPRFGLVVEDAFSRLLIGESGCARLSTPPALQQHSPFSTLHFLTCLYKAGEGKPAVRCAVLLYGPRDAEDAVREAGGNFRRSSHIEEQSQLLAENSPDILTIYDTQGIVLHQNNASIAFLGNQISFTPSTPWASNRQDFLRALFHLSPGKYEEMMAVMLSRKGLAGERPAQEVNHPFDLSQTPARTSVAARCSAVKAAVVKSPPRPDPTDAEEAAISVKPSVDLFMTPTAMAFPAKRLLSRSRTTSDGAYTQRTIVHSHTSGYLGSRGHQISPSASESARVRRLPQRTAGLSRGSPEAQTASPRATGDGAWLEEDLHAVHEALMRSRLTVSLGYTPTKPHPSPNSVKRHSPQGHTRTFPTSRLPSSHHHHHQQYQYHSGIGSGFASPRLHHASPRISGQVMILQSLAEMDSNGAASPLVTGETDPGACATAAVDGGISERLPGASDTPFAVPLEEGRAGTSRPASRDFFRRGSRLLNNRPSCSSLALSVAAIAPKLSKETITEGSHAWEVAPSVVESEIESLGRTMDAAPSCASPRCFSDHLTNQNNTCSLSACSVASSVEPSAPSVLHHRVTATCVRDMVLGVTRVVLTQVDVTEQTTGIAAAPTATCEAPTCELGLRESGGDRAKKQAHRARALRTPVFVALRAPRPCDGCAPGRDGLAVWLLGAHLPSHSAAAVAVSLTRVALLPRPPPQVQRERQLQELVFAEEKLLESVFPRHVIEELTQRVITLKPTRRDRHMATSHEQVTILFADLVGFTTMSEMMTPEEVMLLLNRLYTALDDLLDIFGVYKVETIGDCYVVAGGLMQKDQDNFQAVRRASSGVCPANATSTMMFAKAMLEEAAKVMHPRTHKPLRLRVGMHTGPVMSGVVGTRMPRFCLFGDSINTASRMESTSQPGCIHVSASTHALLQHSDEWKPTGGVQVKGKGLMETYFWVPPGPNPPPTGTRVRGWTAAAAAGL